MQSQHITRDIKRLTYKVVKNLIEKTGGHLEVPTRFIEIYNEACKKPVGSNDIFDQSNIQMRQAVKDNLVKNGYILENVKDVDSIYIKKKAIEDYDNLPEEKW